MPALEAKRLNYREVAAILRPAGPCASCGGQRYSEGAFLCSRCWAIVPQSLRDEAGNAARALEVHGWDETLNRHRAIALIACRVAAATLR